MDEDSENCCQYVEGGRVWCSAIGSEDCDWCPYRDEVGTKVEDTQRGEE